MSGDSKPKAGDVSGKVHKPEDHHLTWGNPMGKAKENDLDGLI